MRRTKWVLGVLCLLLLDGAVFAGPPAARRQIDGIQKIFVVHSSHWDYGYTDPPENLPALLRNHINEMVAKVQTDPRHRYTIESIWVLEDFISAASQQEIDALMQLIRDGRVAVSSAYNSPHSGIMSPEELNRWIYRAKRLRDAHQIPARTATVNDNPGYTWAMPDALAGAGIDRLVSGPNTAFAEEFPLPRAESIFRWRGPGGGEVLTWVSRDAYIEGFATWQVDANTARFFYGSQHPEWEGWSNQQIMEQGITEQIGLLESEGYPYDAVMVLESFDKMSYDPSNQLLQDITTWNATHTSPQIVLATPDEFFDHMVATYGLGAFPVRSGNMTQRWERGKIGSQMVQSRYREMRDSLSAAEVTSSIASQLGGLYPSDTIDHVYRDLMRFDEHGAGCGGTEPGLMTLAEVHQTNAYWTTRSLAQRDQIRGVVGSSLDVIASQIATPGGANKEVVVFNPLSSPRTDVVRTTIDTGGQPFVLRDTVTDAAVAYQTLADGTTEFVAGNVPSMGYKRYRVLVGSSEPQPIRVTSSGTTVESSFYRVTVSSSTGAITSIVDKANGNRELVNASSTHGFNKTVKATNLVDFLGGDPSQTTSGSVTLSHSPGSVSGAIALEFTSPIGRTASPLARVEIRLYDTLKRIDVTNTLDRSRLNYTVTLNAHSEHFYQPLPFNIAVANMSAIVDGNAAAPLRPPAATYLSGPERTAVNNSHTPSRGITLRDNLAGYEVQVVSPEVALYSIGANLNGYVYQPTESTIIAESLAKQDRCKTDDPGNPEVDFILEPLESDPTRNHTIYTSRLSITSGATRTDSAAGAFGAGVCSPLRAKVVSGGQTGQFDSPALSFFSVDAPNVEILTVKRAEFGDTSDLVVRVRERDGLATSTLLRSHFAVESAFDCTLLEEPIAPIASSPVALAMAPYQTKTIRLRLGQGPAFAGDSIGAYDPGTGTWFVRNTNTPGNADVTAVYGAPNRAPITGDWNGDGVDTIGIYDRAAGVFFLKNTIEGGDADLVYFFGPPGSNWVPIAGDWNGDGVDTIGLYDPASATFFLRNAHAPGPADVTFIYGAPNAQPLGGDWNGDGVDTIGIYDPAVATFFLKNTNGPGNADVVFVYGTGSGTARAGDWNGDGVDTVALYGAGSAVYFLRDENSPGPASTTVIFGPPNLLPLGGNWDGE